MKHKTFFIVFKGLSFGEKKENLIKNSGHKLKHSVCVQGNTLKILHEKLPSKQQVIRVNQSEFWEIA